MPIRQMEIPKRRSSRHRFLEVVDVAVDIFCLNIVHNRNRRLFRRKQQAIYYSVWYSIKTSPSEREGRHVITSNCQRGTFIVWWFENDGNSNLKPPRATTLPQ